MSDSFQIFRGSLMRLCSRRVCSSALTSSQYLSSRIPDSTIASSTAGTRWRNRTATSSVQNPITRSTPARLYQLRSKITTSPPAGRCGTYRCRYICDFSRSVGAGRATTRNTRGLTRSVIRLIVPPFPAVSLPSNTTQILAPVALTHSCMATSSPCRTRISCSYSLRFILAGGCPGSSCSWCCFCLFFLAMPLASAERAAVRRWTLPSPPLALAGHITRRRVSYPRRRQKARPFPRERPGRRYSSLAPIGHHDDWAVGMVHNLAADRADHEPGEAARTAGPNHHQVGRPRRIDQLFRRETNDGPHRHRGRLGVAELAEGLGRQLLSGLALALQVRCVPRECDRVARPPTHRDRVNCQDGDRCVPGRPFVEGPFQRTGGVGRSVDADRDTRHLLPPSNRAATMSSPELTFYCCPIAPAGPGTFGAWSGAFHPGSRQMAAAAIPRHSGP